MSDASFAYDVAFDRNIGWITADEQRALRHVRVAIAGMGGVGGVHLLTLTRMGIGAFNISDLDVFELANFNRQAGAAMSTLGRPKVEVMAEMARDINPELKVRPFPDGIHQGNIDTFLEDVDLFVDGFDFFVPEIRSKVFRRCSELGIPAITAGPIGFGTCYIIFLPGQMTFEQYFRMEGLPKEQQYARFLVGLAPKALHRHYLVDPSRLNLTEQRGPSSAAAVQLCAGVVGGEAIKILLERGRVRAAPYYHQFDVHTGRFICRPLYLGNNNPLQRLKLKVIEKTIAAAVALGQAYASGLPATAREIEQILDVARWAPSGDNSQPWRFEILSDDSVRIHLKAQSDEDIYDYNDGQPSLLSGGMLLETIRIAASAYGRSATWSYEEGNGLQHRIRVDLVKSPGISPDPLLPAIKTRSVDRSPYKRQRLSAEDKAALAAALGDELTVRWHERLRDRLALARLNARATDIRLRIPEAFKVHRRVIDWDRNWSPTGIPAKAVGLDAMTLKIMRWGFGDWRRLDRMNRMPGATGPAIMQMDHLPAIHSGALFTIRMSEQPTSRLPADRLLRFGSALQRFWLTAEQRKLSLQPAMATAIFAHYGRHDVGFTEDPRIKAQAKSLADELARRNLGTDDLIFLGRIGHSKRQAPLARSIRRPLADLLIRSETSEAAGS